MTEEIKAETFEAALRRQRSDISADSNRLIRAVRMRAQYAAENEENGYSLGYSAAISDLLVALRLSQQPWQVAASSLRSRRQLQPACASQRSSPREARR